MYRNLLNRLPLLFLLLIIGFCSESRKSKNDFLKESISEFKDSRNLIEIATFFPEQYNEVVKDSILSNGFKVKIKTFTNMNKSIKAPKSNSTKHKIHYRQIESDVIVFKGDKQIFNKKIDAEFLEKHFNHNKLKDYIGNTIYVNEEATLKTNTLILIASFYKPNDNNCVSYNIVIDENGMYKLNTLDYART